MGGEEEDSRRQGGHSRKQKKLEAKERLKPTSAPEATVEAEQGA